MVIDEDVLRTLRALSKEGGATQWFLVRKYGISTSKIPKIIEWLERHNLARVIRVKKHIIVIKTKNLDDFLKKVEDTIKELEQVLSSYKPEHIAPEPVPDIEQVLSSLSRHEGLCLVGLKLLQPTIVSDLAEFLGLYRFTVSNALEKLRVRGLVEIHVVGGLKVVELTGRGMYVAEKLEELAKLLGGPSV